MSRQPIGKLSQKLKNSDGSSGTLGARSALGSGGSPHATESDGFGRSMSSIQLSGVDRSEKRKIKMVPVDTTNARQLEWLKKFIHENHTIPQYIMPTKKDLCNPVHRYFRAVVVHPKADAGKVVGISAYEVRTPFLVETEKTIIVPSCRGQGWGRLVSEGIEAVVRRAGFKKIRSTIYATNFAMLTIKLAQGYVIEGYHPDHDAPGLHEYSLGKVLS